MKIKGATIVLAAVVALCSIGSPKPARENVPKIIAASVANGALRPEVCRTVCAATATV
jgi:hypothetical protein